MLKNLIASKTRRILLNTFFTNPDAEYYTRQLSAMHKMSVGTLHRELKKLSSSGILNSREMGNLKLFSLNKQNTIYEEMKSIMYKTGGIIKSISDTIKNINSVKAAFVYGSFAKGDERQDSDVDLFLVGDNINEDELVLKISSLEKNIFREINYTLYTEDEYTIKKKKKDSFVWEVIKGKKIFLKGDHNDL